MANLAAQYVGVVAVWIAVIIGVAIALSRQSPAAVRPFGLAMTDLDITVYRKESEKVGGVQVGVKFQNFLETPIEYEVESMVVTLDSRTVSSPEFSNRGSMLAPHQTQSYRFPVIGNIDFARSPLKGTVTYRVVYGSPGQKRVARADRHLTYLLSETSPDTFFWTYTIESQRDESVP